MHTHGFRVTCNFSGCKNDYTNVSSYSKHVQRVHCDHQFLDHSNWSEPDDVRRNLNNDFDLASGMNSDLLLSDDGKQTSNIHPAR